EEVGVVDLARDIEDLDADRLLVDRGHRDGRRRVTRRLRRHAPRAVPVRLGYVGTRLAEAPPAVGAGGTGQGRARSARSGRGGARSSAARGAPGSLGLGLLGA